MAMSLYPGAPRWGSEKKAYLLDDEALQHSRLAT